MYKKSQITIFIIILIMVILVISIFFIFQNLETNNTRGISSLTINTEKIVLFTENCLYDISLEGIKKISSNGGYFPINEPYQIYQGIVVPYYLYNQEINYPTLEEIEISLENYIEANLWRCINDYEIFEEEYNIIFEEPKVIIDLKNKVFVTLNQKTSISKNKHRRELNNFNIELDLNYLTIHNTITELMEEKENNIDYFPNSVIATLSENNNFIYNIIYQEQDLIINLLFRNIYKDHEVLFIYATKYD